MASIYKRGKTWAYKVYYYDNGKQKAVSKSGFKTKAEAKDASVIRENEMLQGKNFSKERTFLADYMENWRKLYKDDVVSLKTLQQIKIVTNYVRENYNLMLKDITHENYQEFLNKVAENHAKETVKKYHTYVKAALKYAIRTNILSVNPAEGAILKGVDSKTKKEELKFLSLDEFKALEEALVKDIRADYTTRYIILFSMYTGARFGECLGLTWDCVDFENEKIKIEKGFDYQFTNDFTEGKTKSSKRTIDVSQRILTLLDELPRNKNVVFERVSNNAVNKSLHKALLRAGIKKKVTFHALRHTHASILLSKGVQLLTVSKRLGHSDPNITLQTYAHILDEMKDSESDKIKQIF
jgi:integrase family protein|nr:MAG TPA: Integrase [Caudoviricetes sp.]